MPNLSHLVTVITLFLVGLWLSFVCFVLFFLVLLVKPMTSYRISWSISLGPQKNLTGNIYSFLLSPCKSHWLFRIQNVLESRDLGSFLYWLLFLLLWSHRPQMWQKGHKEADAFILAHGWRGNSHQRWEGMAAEEGTSRPHVSTPRRLRGWMPGLCLFSFSSCYYQSRTPVHRMVSLTPREMSWLIFLWKCPKVRGMPPVWLQIQSSWQWRLAIMFLPIPPPYPHYFKPVLTVSSFTDLYCT